MKTAFLLVGSTISFAVAVYFGLTAHGMLEQGYNHDIPFTDWGKVALALVFGLTAVVGVVHFLRKHG